MNIFLISLGKLIVFFSKSFNLGAGSTWPGHIALSVNKNFIKEVIKLNPHLKIILIAGTNGKTTTGKLIQTILKKSGKKVFQNESGANLLNGIASSILLHSSILSTINYEYAIFEVDEATLPLALEQISPDYLILLNLFRDQLDRYGEVNTIAKKWEHAIRHLPSETKLILNADDPQIASLRPHLKGVNVKFFGLSEKKSEIAKTQHAADSTHCPNCGKKLIYKSIYFSHLGDWECRKCGYKHPSKAFAKSPFYPLVGVYNQYNTNSAVLLVKIIGIKEEKITDALKNFKPAFGRQEILNADGKKVQILLSKNPTSFNESLRTISSLNANNLLIVLNDRIPDGHDVSWIWDVDFEEIDQRGSVSTAGDRTYDMALRLKYAGIQIKDRQIYTDLGRAISENLANINKSEILYILPTYSAMLEARKMLTGKSIL